MVDVDTTGVVLAAGAGTRYGMPKILVPAWLDRAVTALRDGGCAPVAVVTGAARPPLPDDTEEIHCPDWERGIGASLRAALIALQPWPQRLVVHVVDCPDIGRAVVRRVLDDVGEDLGRSVFDGRPGHPVVLPRRHLAPLLAELADDDGAGRYLRAHTHTTVECGDLATGADIDVAPPPTTAATPAGDLMEGSDL
ncbi:NTP transferase domain-containing protein [Georgenia sp. MJ173]|uniref:nucleotidyltransferase family protein n=1 Tax=Georgenia sunbinii TaxID=3117728 RepID=UPI002F269040